MSLAKDKIFPFGFVGDGFDVAMNCDGEFFVGGEICEDPNEIVENLKMAGQLFLENESEITDKLEDDKTSAYYGIFVGINEHKSPKVT